MRDQPTDIQRREELRRKLHALSSSAKLMKLDAMERAIAEGVGLLDRTGIDEPLDALDLDVLEQVLEDLPALAWGDSDQARSSRVEKVGTRASDATYSALVIGSALIAEALLEAPEDGKPTFACECTPDTQAAFDLAKQKEPDLVVLDADLTYSTELVEALMDDPLTEATPLVVVGSFAEAGAAARYIAMGVTKTLAKPTSRETLRAICEEAVDPRKQLSTAHAALGEPTLEELGERLAVEIREAIVGRADPAARKKRIPLGEGTEVLGALWGAIARVREVVTARSDGDVRFATDGAMTVAPLLTEIDVARSDRSRIRARGASAEVRLQGRRVVIADDDPAVVWFLADLLKTAGCTVHEAFDGRDALELAYKTSPDLIVSDILMPGIDGFSLCRALRRDVALRDVPVILLSWKEDLLQRVRELGAGAAGYVRKESDTRAIVARVREALRPRARIEARLLEDGEVRGRLDGVSVRTLLEIVCATRPEARVSVRDASFLYEVEIRWGAPQRATRTSGDGMFMKGPRVLAAMLGASAGRFTVTNSTTAIEAELDGNLAAQLAKPIARARAATSLLSSEGLARIAKLGLDDDMLADYGRATPKRPHDLAKRLAAGASPRTLVLDGACEPSLLEDLACDLAVRGLVTSVHDDDGKDMLSPLVTQFMQYTDTRASFAPRTATPSPVPMLTEALVEKEEPKLLVREDDFSCLDDAAAPFCESPAPNSASSLEDAVMREVATRSPEPVDLFVEKPAMVEPSSLVLRTSPPPSLVLADDEDDDAIVPGSRTMDPTPPHEQLLALAEPTIIDDTAYGEEREEAERADDAFDVPAECRPMAPADPDRLAKTPLTHVRTADDERRPAKKGRGFMSMVAFVAATALVAWAVMHFSHRGAAVDHAQAPRAAEPVATTTVQSATNVDYTDVAADANVPAGQGVVDVTANGDDVILVDGTDRGRGRVTIPIFTGQHDVKIHGQAGEDTRTVDVRAGKVAHVKF